MEIFLFWIAFSVAVGMFAHHRRGRNGLGWGLISLLISPLLAIVFVAVLPSIEETP